MKIKKIEINNKKKNFEVTITGKGKLYFPFSKLRLHPTAHNKIKEVFFYLPSHIANRKLLIKTLKKCNNAN